LGTREVPKGTSAIEVLKEYEGAKEAVFAKVSCQVEVKQGRLGTCKGARRQQWWILMG
jgi:uncharacterized protein with FMN-binding domain